MSYRPYQQIERRRSRQIRVGKVLVGGDAPITVQTMTNTLTTDVAGTIAAKSLPSVLAAKEAVDTAFETTLAPGVHLERRLFHALFATEDQKEGMAAFAEKREPRFTHR